MRIEVAKTSGFCFGVDNAVRKAYEIISRPEDNAARKKYMLGKLIHNAEVTDDLTTRGFILVNGADELEDSSIVLVRAHGISPQDRIAIEGKHAEIIDCTCPFVTKIHVIIKDAYEKGRQIILVGSKDHPEIVGINGECKNTAIIITGEDDPEIDRISDIPSIIASQTTFSIAKYDKICELLNKKIANLQIFDTICNTTEKRQKEAEELAERSDVMIVIGDRESSNTKRLYELCLLKCRKTYMVEKLSDLDGLFMEGIPDDIRVGIVAGASTPKKNIGEVINKMSEKVTQDNQQEQDSFSFQEYVDNIPQLHRGATVRGKIIRFDNDYVFVDVKDKSEGRIPVHEFTSDPDFDLAKAAANHEEVDVYVRSIKNSDLGKEIILSKARGDNSKGRELVEAAFQEKQPVIVKITNVVKDGVIGNYEGVDIYIHRTQLEMSPVEELDVYKGKSIEILVTQYDPDKKRLRVSGSRRVLLTQERREKASAIWSELEPGKVFQGTVRSLTDFGAFVDIGGVDGLVHVSELSWNRIRHPSEIVKPGDVIEVYIKDFDPEKHRISLGYKKSEDDPYRNVEDRFPVGTIITGKIVRMFPFGAFVEIAPGVDALCHISQISNMRLVKPSDALRDGMEVTAKVMEVNSETRRISISIKEVEPIDPIREPLVEAVEEVPVAEVVEEAPAVEAVEEAPATEVVEEVPAVEAVEEAPAAEVVEEAPAADESAEEAPAEEDTKE
ncbi:MAG: bifunctional 4-hydroxy-3-methylbut-2-enyl diphosphate reductase/30S ribosomal protein S1 [Saccharofermentanales bacterium]